MNILLPIHMSSCVCLVLCAGVSVFSDKDIQAAEVVQILQSLGMSLKEFSAINEEHRNGELTCERSLEITRAQLVRLEAKATELERMIRYARAKSVWLTRGKQGRRPDFGGYMRRGSRVNVEQTDRAVQGTVNQPSIAQLEKGWEGTTRNGFSYPAVSRDMDSLTRTIKCVEPRNRDETRRHQRTLHSQVNSSPSSATWSP